MRMLLDHKVTPCKLLVILPELYKNLKDYPESLCQLKSCGVPALKTFYLDPFNKHTSPYGTDVAQATLKYTQQCSTDLMNTYLKQVCNKLTLILKQQRGNQYGFGDDPKSQELVTKKLTSNLMNDMDITTTMYIEICLVILTES